MVAAAIDLGTNSLKILIVRRDVHGHMHVLFRHRTVVRLGEGTFGKGKIPRYVQDRALQALESYAQFLDVYKVDLVRATGTSALRDAKNGPDFVREVRIKTGIALEILPADEEARLIVKGVSSRIKLPRKPTLFIDIGGGSCEMSLVEKKKIEKFVSLPLGAVRLTELYIPQSKANASQLRRLIVHVRKTLRDRWPNPKNTNVAIGSAGTIRSLARVISGTELTDDDDVIKSSQLDRTFTKISKLSKKRIASLPGVDAKRAEILLAGTAVLREVFAHFKIRELRVSNRGLREGLLIDLFERPHKPQATPDSSEQENLDKLSAIGRHFNFDRHHCYHVWNLARLLFEELLPVHGISRRYKPILMTAAVLHDVGKYIQENSNHKHTFYIIENVQIPFLNDREHFMAAVLARYHKKSPPKPDHEGYKDLAPDERKTTNALAAILRVADALDADHDQRVRWLKCQWGPGKVRVTVDLKADTSVNNSAIKDKGKYFEELFGVTLEVTDLQPASNPRINSPEIAARAKP